MAESIAQSLAGGWQPGAGAEMHVEPGVGPIFSRYAFQDDIQKAISDILSGKKSKGLVGILKTLGSTAGPLAIPAALASPFAAVTSMVGGTAGAGLAGIGAHIGGLSQEQQELASLLGGLAGGITGGAMPRRLASPAVSTSAGPAGLSVRTGVKAGGKLTTGKPAIIRGERYEGQRWGPQDEPGPDLGGKYWLRSTKLDKTGNPYATDSEGRARTKLQEILKFENPFTVRTSSRYGAEDELTKVALPRLLAKAGFKNNEIKAVSQGTYTHKTMTEVLSQRLGLSLDEAAKLATLPPKDVREISSVGFEDALLGVLLRKLGYDGAIQKAQGPIHEIFRLNKVE